MKMEKIMRERERKREREKERKGLTGNNLFAKRRKEKNEDHSKEENMI